MASYSTIKCENCNQHYSSIIDEDEDNSAHCGQCPYCFHINGETLTRSTMSDSNTNNYTIEPEIVCHWYDEDDKIHMIEKLTNKIKRLFNQDQQDLYKAGYMNDCADLTDRGWEELKQMLLEKYEKELADKAREDLKEMKESK